MPIKVVAPSTPKLSVSQNAASSVGVFIARGDRGPAGPQGLQGPPGPMDTTAINAHIADPTPHPSYDDLPSLTLLFENGII